MTQTDRLFNGLLVVEPLYRYGEIRICGSFVKNFLRNVISRQKNLLFRLNPGISNRKSRVFPPIMVPVLEELELVTKIVAARVLPQIELAVACIPNERLQALATYESSRVPNVPVRVLGPAGEYLYQAIHALSRGAIAVAFCKDRGFSSDHASEHVYAAERELHYAAGVIVRIERLFRRNTQVIVSSRVAVVSVPEELELRLRRPIRRRKLTASDAEVQSSLPSFPDLLDLPASGRTYWHRRTDTKRAIESLFSRLFPQDPKPSSRTFLTRS
jgi:hypothetical protein